MCPAHPNLGQDRGSWFKDEERPKDKEVGLCADRPWEVRVERHLDKTVDSGNPPQPERSPWIGGRGLGRAETG